MPVDEHLYPVNLVLAGRRCVVVGGGAVAARKVRGLLAAGALVHVVAPEIGDEIRQLAAPAPPTTAAPPPAHVTLAERPYATSDLDGAWLVVTATDRPEVNARVRADADAVHLWCNAADDPASCSFTLPAISRQGPVTVAVSTSGYSPALAVWIRDAVGARLDELIGSEQATAALATLLAEARAALQASGRSTEGVDWRPAFETGMLDAIRAGDLTRARRHLEDCLSSSQD